ncbi:MAG: Rho termination factor N-terminal domain-containing protein, partial [Mycobacterium sp.]
MTDTDLITAGESTDGNQLSISVPTDAPDVKTNAPVGSLSTMVLPELRALANQSGVKGTSGMRKNELIAAIQETRGHANGASAAAAPEPQNGGESAPPASAEVPAAQGEQNDSPNETQRRQRRSGSREAGSNSRAADEQGRDGTPTNGADKAQRGQQDTRTDERGSDAGNDQSGDQQGSGGQQQSRGGGG